jgi:hypothetical protein
VLVIAFRVLFLLLLAFSDLISPFFLTFFGSSPNPKPTRGTVEEEIGDETARGQGVPSVVVNPSSGTAEAATERSPPPADCSLMVTVAVASLGKIQPLTGEPMATSTLGTGPVPRLLKKKVLLIKKSAL